MPLPVNLNIARIHLLSRKKQTIIAILGVTFGISMFILMISLMKGVGDYYHDALILSTPDIRLYNDIKKDYGQSIIADFYKTPGLLVQVHNQRPKAFLQNIKDATTIIENIRNQPEVEAASPVISTPAIFQYGPVPLNGLIDGVNIREELKLFSLSEKMAEGKAEDLLTTNNGIILGKGLAEKLNAGVGDYIILKNISGISGRFKVVGTFLFGIGLIDNVRAYMKIEDMQQFLGKTPDYVTDIHIKLKDMNQAGEVARYFSKKYGYIALDWATANASVLAGNRIRDFLTSMVSIALLVVAGFGIYNIMNMNIAGKLKDIAILKAQGYTRTDILQIFLSQSLVIGVIGATLGLVLGYFFSYTLSRVEFPKSDMIILKYYPVRFQVSHYVFGFFFGVITTFLAGYSPSIKAAKTDPVNILRG